MPNPTDPHAALKRNSVLIASMLFMIVGTGSIYFLVVALKLISAEFGWPRAVPSIGYSLQYFGGGIGGILMGYWLDRSGMGMPALTGAVMIGGGSLLVTYVSNEWQLYFIYGVMMGLFGRATLFSPIMANITRWFDHKGRSRAIGIVGSGQALSGVLWPPVFQASFDAIGWRQTSFWYGVFTLATLVPLSLILFQKPPQLEPPPAPAKPSSDADTSPAKPSISALKLQVILSLAAIGCCVAMSLPLAHLVSHVSDIGYSPVRGAEILSVMLATAAVSSFFGVGFLGGRYGGLKAIFVFSTGQAVFLAALAFVSDLSSLYIVAVLFGLGYGGILPCYPIIVREHLPPAQVGRRTAVVILCAGSGMAIGSWLGGYVFDITGAYRDAFLIGVLLNIFNLALIGMLIARTRDHALSPT